MKIQLLNGGLGNQLFQYIFVRFAERNAPEETWFFDDSSFFVSPVHNGYELEKIWGLKLNLLSKYFDEDVWEEIIRLCKTGLSLPQIFKNMGLPLVLLAETSDFSFDGKVLWTSPNQFHPEIINISVPNTNIYYHGYWINKQWFAQYREENLKELAFPELTDKKNLQYADEINNCLSVGIHIRRGGYFSAEWAIPNSYYLSSCKAILDKYPDANFFVVTNDIDWCKANEKELGLDLAPRTVYVTGNVDEKCYIDAQLLSMCQGLIMSNSSFCYFATLMNKNLKFWINPTGREV